MHCANYGPSLIRTHHDPSIPAPAALAVQRPRHDPWHCQLFGGRITANKVADMVEQVSGIGFTAEQQQANIESSN